MEGFIMNYYNMANNQIIIEDGNDKKFVSYGTTICTIINGSVTLDRKNWSFSRTTVKYLSRFLEVSGKKEIQTRIENGIYKLGNLNFV